MRRGGVPRADSVFELVSLARSVRFGPGAFAVIVGSAAIGSATSMLGDDLRFHVTNVVSLVLLSALVVQVVRMHRRVLGWWLIVGAWLAFLVAQVAGGAGGYAEPVAQAANGVAYTALGAGVVLLLKASARVLIDVASTGAIIAFPLIGLFGLLFCRSSTDPEAAYTLVVYMLLDLLLIMIPLAVIARGMPVLGRFVMLLGISATALVIGDTSLAVGIASGHPHEPGPVPQTAWCVSAAVLVLAASVREPLRPARVRLGSSHAIAPLILGAVAWGVTAELALGKESLGAATTIRLVTICAIVVLVCFAIRLAISRRDLALAEHAESLESDRLRMTMRYGVGRATLGIAHDLSNVVWTQSLALASARKALDAGRIPRDEIADMDGASESLKHIIERLWRAVMTDAVLASEAVEVGSACEGVAALMRRRWPDISAIRVTREGDPVVFAPRATVEQVLLNVVSNAAQAAGAGGTVDILVSERDEYAEISVQDDGPGVPAVLEDRIFAPFFSTRSDTGGQGLGLSIVRAALAELDGHIELVSRKDPTVFRVRIPAMRPSA